MQLERKQVYCDTIMSVVVAIDEALKRHLEFYDETPIMVLVGPGELELLLTEIANIGPIPAGMPLQVFGMIVVPKCADGIDFQISCGVSKAVLANKLKQVVASHDN